MMRRAAIACLAVLAGPLAATEVSAQTTAPVQPEPPRYHINSFRDLADLCSKPDTDPNYTSAISLCAGYMSGVLDYHRLDTTGRNSRMRRVCVPAPAPARSEALDRFRTWYSANQQYGDEPAANGVMRFLISAFPCGKAGQS